MESTKLRRDQSHASAWRASASGSCRRGAMPNIMHGDIPDIGGCLCRATFAIPSRYRCPVAMVPRSTTAPLHAVCCAMLDMFALCSRHSDNCGLAHSARRPLPCNSSCQSGGRPLGRSARIVRSNAWVLRHGHGHVAGCRPTFPFVDISRVPTRGRQGSHPSALSALLAIAVPHTHVMLNTIAGNAADIGERTAYHPEPALFLR